MISLIKITMMKFTKKTLLTEFRQISHLLHKSGNILYAENGLYAVEKPASILSHPNSPADVHKSIVNGIYDKKQELFRCLSAVPDAQKEVVYLINRIDSATSGILLMTTDSKISKIVKKLFVERKISKIYKAIVFNHSKTLMKQKSLHWEHHMEVKRIDGFNRAVISDTASPSAMVAITDVICTDPHLYSPGRKKEQGNDLMLLELRPKTGYTHQIRHQCAVNGLPITGDNTYGDFKKNKAFQKACKFITDESAFSTFHSKRMFLHSYSIEFSYILNDLPYTFKAVSKLPIEFKRILDYSYNTNSVS